MIKILVATATVAATAASAFGLKLSTNKRIGAQSTQKAIMLGAIILISTAMAGAPQFIFAQSTPDWTLTVHVVGVPFGYSTLHIEVHGPFGSNLYDNIRNSEHPFTSFNLPGEEYPTGYPYRICVST
ncbi:MAG TPA: hypothetical protein VGE97_00430, partial [Nitrososphaera sp.]